VNHESPTIKQPTTQDAKSSTKTRRGVDLSRYLLGGHNALLGGLLKRALLSKGQLRTEGSSGSRYSHSVLVG